MATLFGLNIGKIIKNALERAGGVHDGVLTHYTSGARTPGSLAGGSNPTFTTHGFKGFAEKTAFLRDGTLVTTSHFTVSILGASLDVVPEVHDTVALGGSSYVLISLQNRDPANALYVFQAAEN